jgi:cell division protein FtsW
MSAVLKSQPFVPDQWLLGAVVGLVALGVVMVGSASISIAVSEFGEPSFFLVRHLAALAIGLGAAALMMALPTDVWFRMNGLLLLAGLALLALVFVPGLGQEFNGAKRWLQIGPLGFQASEPARLALVMYLASYAVRHNEQLASTFTSFLKPLLLVGVAGLLLLEEPDYGATVVVTATSLGILFVGGSRLRDFLLAVLAAAGILGVLAVTSEYRLQRLMTFLDPWSDPFDNGFQLTNSLIAIGRGDWFGAGLGESVQKLFYLPEAHTDFVFAVLAEELGLVGSTLVVVLFAILVWRILATGQRAIDSGRPFQGLVCVGIGLMLGLEAFINIGVNTGLLPTKGLTLPLLSYGRSSVVTTLLALGLVMRVAYEDTLIPSRQRNRRSRT